MSHCDYLYIIMIVCESSVKSHEPDQAIPVHVSPVRSHQVSQSGWCLIWPCAGLVIFIRSCQAVQPAQVDLPDAILSDSCKGSSGQSGWYRSPVSPDCPSLSFPCFLIYYQLGIVHNILYFCHTKYTILRMTQQVMRYSMEGHWKATRLRNRDSSQQDTVWKYWQVKSTRCQRDRSNQVSSSNGRSVQRVKNCIKSQ
jgi:hypothetical protein